MHEAHTEIILAGLLLAVAGLVTLARVMNVPYPIFLVLGGLAIGAIPGLPEITLDPDLVLLIFLPPLLYGAAFFTSLRDLRRNAAPISALSIGLVLATCVAVAVCVHAVVPGLSWEAAFVLGAIVSPTDPVAATAIAGRLGVPRRVVTVVEGESLINDATAITAYRVALAAITAGSFSLVDAGGEFVKGAVGRRGDRARGRLGDRAGALPSSTTRRSSSRSRCSPATRRTCRRRSCSSPA